MQLPQSVPSEQSLAGDFARQIAQLLGAAYQPADNTAIGAELLAYGGAIRDGRQTNLDGLSECFPDTAEQTLNKWEETYGLPVREDLVNLSLPNPYQIRQARLTAKVRAARAGTPQQITAAVAAIDPSAVLIQNLFSQIIAAGGSPLGVYQFAIILATATLTNATLMSQIQAIVRQMKPAHTRGQFSNVNPFTNFGNNSGFKTDDPAVDPSLSTAIASGSNGQTLPQAIIHVASTTGFAAGGGCLFITTASTLELILYTGLTPTTFTGCSGGTSMMATGNPVIPAAPAGSLVDRNLLGS